MLQEASLARRGLHIALARGPNCVSTVTPWTTLIEAPMRTRASPNPAGPSCTFGQCLDGTTVDVFAEYTQ